MSSYMFFTLKRNDIYCPLVMYSRNHPLYVELDENCHIPYGQFIEWHSGDFEDAIASITENVQRYKDCIARNLQHIEIVKSMSGAMEERMEYINEDLSSNRSLQEEIDELQHCISKLRFMQELTNDYYEVNSSIWIGIETGYKTAEN